jgi:hypothetical protein
MTILLLLGAFVFATFERSLGEAFLLLATFLASLYFSREAVMLLWNVTKQGRGGQVGGWLRWLVALNLGQLLLWSPVLGFRVRSPGLEFGSQLAVHALLAIGLPSVALWWLLKRARYKMTTEPDEGRS